MLHLYILLLSSALLPAVMLLLFPQPVKEIFRDLRIMRILHYVALALFGVALSSNTTRDNNFFYFQQNGLIFLLFSITLAYAAVFAIVTNNIEDLEADKITNPNRPLVTGKMNRSFALRAGILCLGWSLLISFLIRMEMFYCILIISTVYYLYSCRPFRLKRIPFLSKFLIAFNSFAVAVCGFILAGGKLAEFPIVWAIFILVPLALAANFVDIKDIPGDKETGVKTLPVILGEKTALILIAIFTFCTYLMAAIILNIAWLYPVNAVAALLHCYLLFRKPFDERPVFLVYILSLFALSGILFLYPSLS